MQRKRTHGASLAKHRRDVVIRHGRFLLTVLAGVAVLWPAGVKAADPALRLLRSENGMLKATLKTRGKELEALKTENARLCALLKQAGIDPANAPDGPKVAKATSKPARAPDAPKIAPHQPLAGLLGSVPKHLIASPGSPPALTQLQWDALNVWCDERWPDKTVTARLRVSTVAQTRNDPPKFGVNGQLVHPAGAGKSTIACRVYAEFPLEERGKLLAITGGGTVNLVGKIRLLSRSGSRHFFAPANSGACIVSLVDCKVLSAGSSAKPPDASKPAKAPDAPKAAKAGGNDAVAKAAADYAKKMAAPGITRAQQQEAYKELATLVDRQRVTIAYAIADVAIEDDNTARVSAVSGTIKSSIREIPALGVGYGMEVRVRIPRAAALLIKRGDRFTLTGTLGITEHRRFRKRRAGEMEEYRYYLGNLSVAGKTTLSWGAATLRDVSGATLNGRSVRIAPNR